LARVLWFPGEFAISDANYRGIRPQEYAALIDRGLSDRYTNLGGVSEAFSRVALGALLINRKPAGFIGRTRKAIEPTSDETLARSSLDAGTSALGGLDAQVPCVLATRQGTASDAERGAAGRAGRAGRLACEIMSRCELPCCVAVIVRV